MDDSNDLAARVAELLRQGTAPQSAPDPRDADDVGDLLVRYWMDDLSDDERARVIRAAAASPDTLTELVDTLGALRAAGVVPEDAFDEDEVTAVPAAASTGRVLEFRPRRVLAGGPLAVAADTALAPPRAESIVGHGLEVTLSLDPLLVVLARTDDRTSVADAQVVLARVRADDQVVLAMWTGRSDARGIARLTGRGEPQPAGAGEIHLVRVTLAVSEAETS